jgi:hypothetical protein
MQNLYQMTPDSNDWLMNVLIRTDFRSLFSRGKKHTVILLALLHHTQGCGKEKKVGGWALFASFL